MQKIITLLFLGYTLSVTAQITYKETDGPKAGILIRSRQLQDLSKLNLDLLKTTGGNQIWDVRGSYLELEPKEYVGVQNLYFKSHFPGSNLAQITIPNPDSTYLMFEKNTTGLYFIGTRDTASEIVFDPKVILVPFPLTFGMDFTNTSTANFLQTGVNFKVDLQTHSNAESWGMMTTNDGSFPVIKLKTIRTELIDAAGFPFGSQTIESHTWLASGLADPIVTLESLENETPFGTTDDTTLTNSYKQELVRSNDVQKYGMKLSITPNPATDHVSIQCQNMTFESATYTVVNAEGKTVMDGILKNNEVLHLNLNQLATGNYLVQLLLDKKTLLFDILSKQ